MVGNNIPNLYDVLGMASYVECLGKCISFNDPLGDQFLGHTISTIMGGTYPKSWLVGLVNKLESFGLLDASAARLTRMGISLSKVPVTTIPSTASLALGQGGKNMLRSLGRASSPFFIAYGLALFQMETECASACCADKVLGATYESAQRRVFYSLLEGLVGN